MMIHEAKWGQAILGAMHYWENPKIALCGKEGPVVDKEEGAIKIGRCIRCNEILTNR